MNNWSISFQIIHFFPPAVSPTFSYLCKEGYSCTCTRQHHQCRSPGSGTGWTHIHWYWSGSLGLQDTSKTHCSPRLVYMTNTIKIDTDQWSPCDKCKHIRWSCLCRYLHSCMGWTRTHYYWYHSFCRSSRSHKGIYSWQGEDVISVTLL